MNNMQILTNKFIIMLNKFWTEDDRFFDLCENLKKKPWYHFIGADWMINTCGKAFLYPGDWSSDGVFVDLTQPLTLGIDFIRMPWKWVPAMLQIIRLAIEEGRIKIKWNAQPQKIYTSDLQRRTKLLLDFYWSFWLYRVDRTSNHISGILTEELLRVINNKVQTFLIDWDGKWRVLH